MALHLWYLSHFLVFGLHVHSPRVIQFFFAFASLRRRMRQLLCEHQRQQVKACSGPAKQEGRTCLSQQLLQVLLRQATVNTCSECSDIVAAGIACLQPALQPALHAHMHNAGHQPPTTLVHHASQALHRRQPWCP